jgi:hypothetical protein
MNTLGKMSVQVIAQGMWASNLNLLVSNLEVRLGEVVMYATHVRGRWDSLYIDSLEEEEKIIPLNILSEKEILEGEISVGYDSFTEENEYSSVEDHLYWVMFRRQENKSPEKGRYDLAYECK